MIEMHVRGYFLSWGFQSGVSRSLIGRRIRNENYEVDTVARGLVVDSSMI